MRYLRKRCVLYGKKKIPSFTIMELLVVMVLISIVISSGALLYLQFNRYLENNIKQTGTENTVMLFTHAFIQDINQPGEITANNYEITINKKDGNQIHYTFDDKFIVRTIEETSDTFKITINNLEISHDPLSDEFQEIKTNFVSGAVIYPFLWRKEYENGEMFNKEIKN